MSTSTAGAAAPRLPAGSAGVASGARAYFASDSRRTIQTVLGLIWLLDGALQFQSFMYGKGFIGVLTGIEAGQPHWLGSSVNWGATAMQSSQTLFNTLAALIQVAIGIGLLYRPAVRPAVVVSFAWVLVVWWFGEGFGMIFMTSIGMGGVPMASALNGAPGAVLLYGLIGAIAWPNGRPGGLLGVRGTRITWAALWLVMSWLWLQQPSTTANGIRNTINAAPSGMSWLSSLQDGFADVAKGNGLVIALILAAASAVIGVGVAVNWRPKQLLALAVGLNVIYWLVGQGLGGIFAGGATDPNAGPLFILLAFALYWLVPYRLETTVHDEGSHG